VGGVQARIAHPGVPDGLVSSRQDVSPQGCPTVNSSVAAEYFQEDLRPVVLFDGKCNMCNGGVQFMLDWDVEGVFRYASLQSPAGQALLQRSGRGAGTCTILK
jgi:DCC1-like thiol-disulfide oxidoreductase